MPLSLPSVPRAAAAADDDDDDDDDWLVLDADAPDLAEAEAEAPAAEMAAAPTTRRGMFFVCFLFSIG